MLDIVSDIDNNMYFVRENEQDVAVFNSLQDAQDYLDNYGI